MNEIIRNILGRRSVRKYEDRPIELKLLQTIVETARYAPSARNAQDWHFLAIQNKEVLQELNRCVKEVYAQSTNPNLRARGQDPQFSFFFHAPAFIIVSYKEETNSTAPQADCAAALQNIFLAAHSLEIASCWINNLTRLGHEEKVQNYLLELGLPQGNRIYGSAALGYALGEYPQAPERKENNVLFLD